MLSALLVITLLGTTTAVVAAVVASNNGPFTGCLSKFGVIYNARAGAAPMANCFKGDTQIAFSNAQGAQGPQGATGAQGPQGDTGATGATGADGAPGQDGAPGAQGPQGPQGVPGPAGTASGFGTAAAPGSGNGFYECTLGELRLSASFFAYDTPADGRLLPISQYQALFSLLGTMYGGDGNTTFALPNLKAVTPQSANGQPLIYSVCTEGIFPSHN